ncbi:MAG TPA: LPXTG cell wall anchor domain-containing protein [Candidatus Mediterraneibacter norfolkensis]|nr:LPXTG cell wall anchor domain-containing protein [Candidatus Mediterraneibacter norfolkensis]
MRHEECTVCGYEKAAVEIPAAGTAENPTKPSKPSGTLKPGDTQTPPTSSTDTDIPSGGNQTGDKGSTDTGKTDSPQTGDDSNIVLWTVMMLAAGAALTGTLLYNRKKKCSR